MASADGDRSKFFPAIEKKHGEKINYWINRLKELETTKYPEQIAQLRENYVDTRANRNFQERRDLSGISSWKSNCSACSAGNR